MTNILYSYHNPGCEVRDCVVTTSISVFAAVETINQNGGWPITMSGAGASYHAVGWIPVHCISRVWDASAGETVKVLDTPVVSEDKARIEFFEGGE